VLHKAKKDEYTVRLKRAKSDQTKASKELARLDSMMMDAIDGKCVFSSQDLQRRMQTLKDSISELQEVIASTEHAMEESSILLRRIKDEYRQLETWAQVFHESSPDVKKMIASYMIERVTVSREYEVNVDLNITEAQFFGGMKMEL